MSFIQIPIYRCFPLFFLYIILGMEKRHGRKRDWFWHLLGHKRHDERKKSEDQQGKITFLSNYAKQYFSLELDCDIFESLLEDNEWDTKRALADLSDYEEASHGILIEPPPIKQVILGAENDGGTSCYIDALLFAMYISNTTFDPLLTYDIPNDETKVKLQTVMRLFINKMRKGHFISASYVHWFRKVLEEANWHGKDDDGHWAQEDTSELFMFITETFDLPYLPVSHKQTTKDRPSIHLSPFLVSNQIISWGQS